MNFEEPLSSAAPKQRAATPNGKLDLIATVQCWVAWGVLCDGGWRPLLRVKRGTQEVNKVELSLLRN